MVWILKEYSSDAIMIISLGDLEYFSRGNLDTLSVAELESGRLVMPEWRHVLFIWARGSTKCVSINLPYLLSDNKFYGLYEGACLLGADILIWDVGYLDPVLFYEQLKWLKL